MDNVRLRKKSYRRVDDLAGKTGRLEISVSTSVQPMLGDVAGGIWDMRFWNAVSGPEGPCGLLSAHWMK